MSFYDRPPFPKTKLGIHRKLAPNAGLHVSPIQLGAMSIGDKWEALGHGTMNKETSFKLLDAFYDVGGNFIDTANNYQDESSEEFIGEWMEERGIRDQIVIATKFTTNFKRGSQSVLYLGVSDTPAWIVSQANTYAKLTGKTPFIIYQGAWNIISRDFEREILPMAKAFGMALAPWNVLAGGKIRTDAEEQRRRETGEKGRTISGPDWERTPVEVEVSHALEKVAQEIGAKTINAVAIAYVMQKAPYVFPIIGGRKIEHLHSNLEALDLRLEKKHIDFLESVVPLDLGFPYGYFGNGTDYNMLFKTAGYFEKWPVQEAIKPIPQAEGTK
ncbi:NADP-dependent oxidoreductase domain superfamily protein [Abortiporus biennis]